MIELRNKGFTLIELLIVIAITGILASIAILQYSVYRNRSYNSRAVSDLRNAATAQEAYYVENQRYAGSYDSLSTGSDFTTSPDINFFMKGNQTVYTMTSYHPSGNKTYILTGPGGKISND